MKSDERPEEPRGLAIGSAKGGRPAAAPKHAEAAHFLETGRRLFVGGDSSAQAFLLQSLKCAIEAVSETDDARARALAAVIGTTAGLLAQRGDSRLPTQQLDELRGLAGRGLSPGASAGSRHVLLRNSWRSHLLERLGDAAQYAWWDDETDFAVSTSARRAVVSLDSEMDDIYVLSDSFDKLEIEAPSAPDLVSEVAQRINDWLLAPRVFAARQRVEEQRGFESRAA